MKIKLDRFPEGKQKALTMSYDDGYFDDIFLIKIFNAYGIKGTFHINSGLWGKEGRISKSQAEKVYSGHEIASHGYTHQALTGLSKEGIVTEILNDRAELEKITGKAVRGMSYPIGGMNSDVKQILKSIGIDYARTAISTGNFDIPDDFLEWSGTCHHKENLLDKAEEFLQWVPFQMTLMYVWGHSYEFSKDMNWNIIEEFCKKIGGRKEIWYATNIEIYDYIQAVKSLRFTVNQEIVENRSSLDVWISVDNQPMKISAGECRSLLKKKL